MCFRFFTSRHNDSGVRRMRMLPAAALLSLAVSVVFAACEDEKKEIIAGSANPETTPTMTTLDVSTLISDSGITRYRIITPLWYVFDEAKEPTWRFPDGLHVQTYDMRMRPEATIDCDTAIFYKNKQLWRLKGYVNIRNTVGEKFLTEELFWDQRMQKVYSDSFIHIERDQKVIEGYGFESNETMTRYHVLRVSGIFPASQFKTDSTRRRNALDADTAMAPPQPVGGVIPFNPARPHSIVSGEVDDSKLKKHLNKEKQPAPALKLDPSKRHSIQKEKPRKALSN